jgi:hypothetical protein
VASGGNSQTEERLQKVSQPADTLPIPGMLGAMTYQVIVATGHHGKSFFSRRQGHLDLFEHLILMLSALPPQLPSDLITLLLRGPLISEHDQGPHQSPLKSLLNVASTASHAGSRDVDDEAPRVAAAWILAFCTGQVI